jgi:signal transduction histidine kinase
MNEATLERHGVRVVREYGACGAVTADRHKVLQVVVNLIFNAKDATCANAVDSAGDRTVTLRLAEAAAEDGTPVARVAVIDNGVGIRPEDMPHLFRHGFTTRSDGHGFGLHFSANAATQMKGTLSAHSDGPDRGATFTLDLPLAKTETQVV